MHLVFAARLACYSVMFTHCNFICILIFIQSPVIVLANGLVIYLKSRKYIVCYELSARLKYLLRVLLHFPCSLLVCAVVCCFFLSLSLSFSIRPLYSVFCALRVEMAIFLYKKCALDTNEKFGR